MLSGFDLVSSWDSDWQVQMANNSEHIYKDSTYLKISLDKWLFISFVVCLLLNCSIYEEWAHKEGCWTLILDWTASTLWVVHLSGL